ncbi:MAG: hypothetical protein AB7H93_04255 [Vicinamibacterales bacterium]
MVDLPLGALARVSAVRSTLKRGPAPDAATLATLNRRSIVTVYAAAPERTVRVLLPDDTAGYLPRQSLVATDAPLRRRALPAGAVLRERPTDVALAVHVLDGAEQGEELGSLAGYELVRTAESSGWIASAT